MLQANKDIWARILILLGFLVLLFGLITTNQLTLYIHPRAIILVKLAGCVFFLMLLMQCWNLKTAWTQSNCGCHGHRKLFNYLPFIFTLLIAFVLPNSSLNASLVNNKGLNSQLSDKIPNKEYRPLAADLQQTNFIKIADHTFIDTMSEFHHYPEVYAGKEIEMKGFIFKNPSDPPNRLSLVRYIVGCCTADASPYGLWCEIEDPGQFTQGNWYEIQGIIQVDQIKGKNVPVVKVTWIKPVKEPALPYIFPN